MKEAALGRRSLFESFMESHEDAPVDWRLFQICMSIVVATRAGFFIGSGLGVPMEWLAAAALLSLLALGS
ncbi:hypothetical protein [Paenibacillus sp. R14(2021)]|uniref:hypothetical protein n=1 Tax=Paenibacillus sp. R14(2021) TaxID=2859228 RepID=UPI001C612582|nr:hypothetical protein [Paenibacillus sp. R14(2021)]